MERFRNSRKPLIISGEPSGQASGRLSEEHPGGIFRGSLVGTSGGSPGRFPRGPPDVIFERPQGEIFGEPSGEVSEDHPGEIPRASRCGIFTHE